MNRLNLRPLFLFSVFLASLFSSLAIYGKTSTPAVDGLDAVPILAQSGLWGGDAIDIKFFASYEAVALTTALSEPETPSEPVLLMERLIVAQPLNNRTVTNAAGWNFFGSGVAGVPVYINGELIENRTAEGFFSVFMPLERGENRFVFTQEGQEPITRIITNNPPPEPAALPTIGATQMRNSFPQGDEWVQSGTVVTLRVTAPAGSVVYGRIGDVGVAMTQVNPNLRSTETTVLAAEFVGTLMLPESNQNAVADMGRPVYTMTFRGQTTNITAPGHIRQIGRDAPFYARVTSEAVWAFPNPTTVGGSHWMLIAGQRDRVTAITGNWVRLQSGQWVSRASVVTWLDSSSMGENILSQVRYVTGERQDIIIWHTPIFPAMWAEFDGSTLIVGMGIQNDVPVIDDLPEHALFESITIGTHNNAPAYFMSLKEGAHLEGFFFEHEDNQLRLVLRRRPALSCGDKPLCGFTFVIDPGHGGDDPGALGPMGREMAEADINWANSVLLAGLLEELGAQVHLTRDEDEGLDLLSRVAASREVLPDMFISMHANSTAETTNATNIRGFTMWFRNPASRPLAQHFFDALYDINPLTNRSRSINQANFYVVRPSWTPSVLFEVSFMNNIQDFSWMINPQNQANLARGIVEAILDYFGQPSAPEKACPSPEDLL